jgi:hypothetical protein
MGFKAKARKHRQSLGEDGEKKRRPVKEGTAKCGIKECGNWADKSMGGRSISLQNAQDVWGEGSYVERKGRVKVCKSCYRTWKKETKDEMEYY